MHVLYHKKMRQNGKMRLATRLLANRPMELLCSPVTPAGLMGSDVDGGMGTGRKGVKVKVNGRRSDERGEV